MDSVGVTRSKVARGHRLASRSLVAIERSDERLRQSTAVLLLLRRQMQRSLIFLRETPPWVPRHRFDP